MSDSETSSDIKVKYENSNGDNLLEDRSNAKNIYKNKRLKLIMCL
jgi:hypothetical protein